MLIPDRVIVHRPDGRDESSIGIWILETCNVSSMFFKLAVSLFHEEHGCNPDDFQKKKPQ